VDDFEVMPGRYVTGDIYERVRAVLDSDTPALFPGGLSWEQFVHPAGGAYAIPHTSGRISKVELVLLDSPQTTIKINNWHAADLRAGDRPAPHNHRWRTMKSRILAGGYRDHVYWSTSSGVRDEVRTHDAGSDNVLEHHLFHEVVEVEAGETWTVFVGDASQPGDWGYLDPDTGFYTHNAATAPDPNFAAAFRALNPHTASA
jgi:hypothetical protein